MPQWRQYGEYLRTLLLRSALVNMGSGMTHVTEGECCGHEHVQINSDVYVESSERTSSSL